MPFSWLIFVVVFVANGLWLGVMYVTQYLEMINNTMPPRNSLIPQTRQRFLYLQDFYWFWTDLLAVPLITSGFVHLVMNKGYYYLWWGLAVGAIITVIAHMAFLSQTHKPDACYPDLGKVSWTGILHLPYFGIGIGASIICLVALIFTGDLRGPVMWVALVGATAYITGFVFELRSGHFDPLKKVEG